MPRANSLKPSSSSTIKIASDGCTDPVWHRVQPPASGQTLSIFPGWPGPDFKARPDFGEPPGFLASALRASVRPGPERKDAE